MRYTISKTTKAEIERLLTALSRRSASTLREVNDSRRARLLLHKLANMKSNG